MSEPHSRREGWIRAARAAAGWALLGAAAGAAAGWALAGWYATDPPPAAADRLARSAALAHAIYAPEVRHPVEVGAGEEAHLVAWLSKRLQTGLRAPDLGSAGFALLGGRLLPGEALTGAASLPAAQFMYESANGRRLTLYVRHTRSRDGGPEPRYAREGGIAIASWTRGGIDYALASADLGRDELLRLAQAARRQSAPQRRRRARQAQGRLRDADG